MSKRVKDWDYDELDYLRLMKSYLRKYIDVETYQREFFSMNSKRALLSEEASIVIQKAYSDADDYDPVIRLEYTIEELQLRECVAGSVKQLEGLGYQLDDEEQA